MSRFTFFRVRLKHPELTLLRTINNIYFDVIDSPRFYQGKLNASAKQSLVYLFCQSRPGLARTQSLLLSLAHIHMQWHVTWQPVTYGLILASCF